MKSRATLSPRLSGIGNRWSGPGGFVVLDLFLWQLSHEGTKIFQGQFACWANNMHHIGRCRICQLQNDLTSHMPDDTGFHEARNNQTVPNVPEPIDESSSRDIIFGQTDTEGIGFVSCFDRS